MVDPVVDPSERDDLRILRALQLAPRADFAELGKVLGIPAATVDARYRRLRDVGIVHVAGATAGPGRGRREWLLRIRCRRDGARVVAEALARRADVVRVAVTATGVEAAYSVRSGGAPDSITADAVLRTGLVRAVEVAAVLRRFTEGAADWQEVLRRSVTASEAAALVTGRARPWRREAVALEPRDEALLRQLMADGRADDVALGAAARMSPARAAHRLRTLLAAGIVAIDVELSPVLSERGPQAHVWLRVEPSAVRAVGGALSAMAAVGFAAAVSGPHNVHAVVDGRDLDDLHGDVTDRISSLPGVLAVRVSPVIRQVRRIADDERRE